MFDLQQQKVLKAGVSTTIFIFGKIVAGILLIGTGVYIVLSGIEDFNTLVNESQILIENTVQGLPDRVNGIAQTATEILTNPLYQKMKPQEQYDYLKKMEAFLIEQLNSTLEQPAEKIKKLNSLKNLYSGLAKDKLIEIENINKN